jgi:outer membrane protein assembly factor BamB
MMEHRPPGLLMGAALLLFAPLANADDWPTYRHDDRRSGVTGEALVLPLEQAWVRESEVPPMTAWSGPAKWDAYSGNAGLQSMRNFDPAFFVTAAGGAVFFGSSVDHAVHCLDAESGEEKWVALAGGAVRLPPALSDGRAYFGADDGFAYCVDASTGAEIWKHRPAKNPRLIPSDGKLISPWPVRTGVLVRDGLAYFGASLVPWETSYLCAVDAGDGVPKLVTEHADMTLQGAMLASSKTLYVPQGRSTPLLFDLATGKQQASVSGAGGTFCLLTEDERLVAMPGNQKSAGDVIQVADPSGQAARLSFAGADRLVVTAGMAYLHQRGKLRALGLVPYGKLQNEIQVLAKKISDERGQINKLKKSKAEDAGNQIADLMKSVEIDREATTALEKQLPACFLWESEAPAPFDLILAGETVIVGGEGEVAAFNAKDGKQLWRGEVVGKCYGLAVADGRLFASTSRGHIYCFGSK